MGSHSRFKPTLPRVTSSFYWPSLSKDTKSFVATCSTCQHHKYLPTKSQVLLHPLLQPAQVWEDLSMNLIIHLTSSQRHIVIWVMVKCLTNFSHFLALPMSYFAQSLAARFSVEIVWLHGIPRIGETTYELKNPCQLKSTTSSMSPTSDILLDLHLTPFLLYLLISTH